MNDTVEPNRGTELPAPESRTMLAHRMTLTGYFGLLILIPLWNLIWYPPQLASAKVITVVWLVPLIFPLRGLLKGKAYTHAWSGFIAVIYICHALASYITHLEEWLPITIELLLATAFLLGGMYFAKWRGQQLGLELPKQKN